MASLRGTMRAPTNLLQQLAEAVLDNSVSVLPAGGLPALSDQPTAEINKDLEARTPVGPSAGFGEMPDTTVTNFAEDDA